MSAVDQTLAAYLDDLERRALAARARAKGSISPPLVTATVDEINDIVARARRLNRDEVAMAPPAPITREIILAAARRPHAVTAFHHSPGDQHPRKVLLASLGLDLRDPAVYAALLRLHRDSEIVLVRVDLPDLCRDSLEARGHRRELLAESEIRDGGAVYHAIEVRL